MRYRRRTNLSSQAFTLLEVLSSIAIISIVAAILISTLRSSKHSAQVTASLSNLHQLHIALALYQSANGGGEGYGSFAQMDLPTSEQLLANTHSLPLGLPLAIWKSPCGLSPAWATVPTTIQYEYLLATSADNATGNFKRVSELYQDSLVAFSDMNCADPSEPLLSGYFPHLGLGVRLSGALVKQNKAGDYRFQKWWQN
jgi:prepilin-type N-terminal cleavage/methylation domain-containing protein